MEVCGRRIYIPEDQVSTLLEILEAMVAGAQAETPYLLRVSTLLEILGSSGFRTPLPPSPRRFQPFLRF